MINQPGVLITWLCLILLCRAELCHDGIEQHFGTKSAYRFVANKNYTKFYRSDECAKKIWMFIRHGTRLPGPEQIEMMQNLTRIRDLIIGANKNGDGYLLKSDLSLFENWRPTVKLEDAKKLTVEGEKEMLELAERMQARFPKLLSSIYSNTSYVFKFTKTQRTKESARYFAAGLFGRNVVNDVYYPEPLQQDPILRFYKLCDKWKNIVKKNESTYFERLYFDNSTIMNKTIERIQRGLGIRDELTAVDLYIMYVTCAFETAWYYNKKSPWCIPFDLDSIKVLEYAEDLKYYWVDGYGHELTYKQACPALQDLISLVEAKNEYPNTILYFTHSGALLKLLSHLGMHKDDNQLKANGYEVNRNRHWRVSKIDPFANNLAFVLYECDGSKKILTLHNEHVVRLPACPQDDLCDLNKIKEYYKEGITECQFQEMCTYDSKLKHSVEDKV